MAEAKPHILVADDERNIRKTLGMVLEAAGYVVEQARDGEEALEMCRQSHPEIAFVDLHMPKVEGLEVLGRIRVLSPKTAVVIITAYGSAANAVEAMKLGAVDFIEKPFKDQVVLDAVAAAIRRSAEALEEGQRRAAAQALLASFSPREKEAARLIARGQPNKLIASTLGISEKTVHIHRQHVMEKAGIASAAELARLMLRADPTALD